MKRNWKKSAALPALAAIWLALAACGAGDQGIGVDGGITTSLPATVSVKAGTVTTDSWGYTGSAPVQVSAPDQAAITATGHTLLVDAGNYEVSGVSVTKVSYSGDPSTLPAAARNSMQGSFVSYLNISLGAAARTIPALAVTVDVVTVPAGTTLTAYSFDPVTGSWDSPQTAVVDSSQKVTFAVSNPALLGIFK